MNHYTSNRLSDSYVFKAKVIEAPSVSVEALSNVVNPLEVVTAKHVQPGAQLFNLERLESISGGDKGFIGMMTELFISTTPDLLLQLEHAAAFSSWREVALVAHKLKSTVDTMGMEAATTLIMEIEHHAKFTDETQVIPQKVAFFNAIVKQSFIQMKQWLHQNIDRV